MSNSFVVLKKHHRSIGAAMNSYQVCNKQTVKEFDILINIPEPDNK